MFKEQHVDTWSRKDQATAMEHINVLRYLSPKSLSKKNICCKFATHYHLHLQYTYSLWSLTLSLCISITFTLYDGRSSNNRVNAFFHVQYYSSYRSPPSIKDMCTIIHDSL